jgi:peptidyl-prolyl cis-trans isomerase C
MFSLRKIGTPTIAALLMVTLPAWSAFADETAAKPTVKEPTAKEQPVKEPTVKEQPAKEQSVQAEPKASPSDPMVRVNGTTITRQELDRAVKVMLAQNQVQQPLAPEIMKQAQDAALEQLTAAELLYQEASKLEMKDLDKQIADKVAQNRAKFSSDAEFETALKSVDMTPKDMKDFTRKDIVISNFVETRFAAKSTVTDAEARKFYDENKSKYFEKPESVRASHILVGSDEKASPEDRKRAKENAETILKRVKAGEDFAKIATSDSSCPSSAQGGDLGSFGRGQMVPAFEKATFALKVGEVSDVVETQFGYHIIKLTEKQEATTEKFDDVKEKIIQFLKRDKVQKGLSDFIGELKKTAKIEKP